MMAILKPCNILPAMKEVSKNLTTACLMPLVTGMTSKTKATISMPSSPSTSNAGMFMMKVLMASLSSEDVTTRSRDCCAIKWSQT